MISLIMASWSYHAETRPSLAPNAKRSPVFGRVWLIGWRCEHQESRADGRHTPYMSGSNMPNRRLSHVGLAGGAARMDAASPPLGLARCRLLERYGQAGTVRKIIDSHNLDSTARGNGTMVHVRTRLISRLLFQIFFRTRQDSSRHRCPTLPSPEPAAINPKDRKAAHERGRQQRRAVALR
jgi:hypothetical protein